MKDNQYIPSFLTQKRLDDDEMLLLKNTFRNNDHLVKLLRRILWPEYDWEAPLGQTKVGLWVGLDQLMQMSPTDREVVILTQIRLNNAIEQALMQISYLANLPEEDTPEQKTEREKKDSTK